MKFIYKLVGFVFCQCFKAYSSYMDNTISKRLGGGKVIQYPYLIYGIDNLQFGESVNIGKGATLMCTRAPITIKGHFVSGPNLTIITGDHMPVIGKFIDTVTNEDKDRLDLLHEYDKPVIIEEDVWCGINVTILKGVTIGRGCIIAAGAIVTKSMPPYSLVAGIPARVIKKRLTCQEISLHEKSLYASEKDMKRITDH